jgi:HK97 family phage prohead protease
MSVTVFGKLLAPDAMCRDDEGVHAYRLDTLERVLDDPVYVDFDHDQVWRGELVHAETDLGGLFAVAVLDDVDELLDVETPIYWSGEFLSMATRGRHWIGRNPRLLSLGLTTNPASLGLQPVKMVSGDVRRSGDRMRWPCTWRTSHPLLDHAADAIQNRHRSDPLFIADRVPRPQLEQRRRPPLQLRTAATSDVRYHDRVVELVAAPYETPTVVYEPGRRYEETFAYAAFRGEERRADRIKVLRDHRHERAVGRTIRLDPYDQRGLIAELRISKTPLGDETLELAADGVLDASVGFGVNANGERWDNTRTRKRVTSAFLDHIGLVPLPAYETANVLSARTGALL